MNHTELIKIIEKVLPGREMRHTDNLDDVNSALDINLDLCAMMRITFQKAHPCWCEMSLYEVCTFSYDEPILKHRVIFRGDFPLKQSGYIDALFLERLLTNWRSFLQ